MSRLRQMRVSVVVIHIVDVHVVIHSDIGGSGSGVGRGTQTAEQWET